MDIELPEKDFLPTQIPGFEVFLWGNGMYQGEYFMT